MKVRKTTTEIRTESFTKIVYFYFNREAREKISRLSNPVQSTAAPKQIAPLLMGKTGV